MEKEIIFKDSGKRQEFATGAVRDIQGDDKGDYSLLPTRAIRKIAQHYEAGARKYKKANWRRGIPLSRYISSAKRHLDQYLQGEIDEPHCISSGWNILCLIETIELIKEGKLPKELDDLFEIRTGYTEKEYQEKFGKKDT